MKTLYVVRHAKSSWKYPNLDDFERPLNKRGRMNAPFMGKKIQERNIMPGLILSSPAKRARKTAMEIATLINGYRAEKGLYQYVYNTTLESVAQKHTDYQVSIQLSTHAGEGGSTAVRRGRPAGVRRALLARVGMARRAGDGC